MNRHHHPKHPHRPHPTEPRSILYSTCYWMAVAVVVIAGIEIIVHHHSHTVLHNQAPVVTAAPPVAVSPPATAIAPPAAIAPAPLPAPPVMQPAPERPPIAQEEIQTPPIAAHHRHPRHHVARRVHHRGIWEGRHLHIARRRLHVAERHRGSGADHACTFYPNPYRHCTEALIRRFDRGWRHP